MRHEGDGETEMEARGIAHRRIARREIGMHGKGRLHIGEGGDDDAPDALDGVEREDAAVALNEAPHHLGLARRPERRTGFLGALDRDQRLDDLAALDQQPVHRLVDAIDVAAQVRQRRHGGRGRGHDSAARGTARSG
jgi:hypothetical protein